VEDDPSAIAYRLLTDRRNPVEPPDGLIGCLDAILRAPDIETVWALLRGAVESYGFDGVIYGYSPHSRGQDLGPQEEFLLLSTLDHGFLNTLVEQRYYRESITFNWALLNPGVASWSMTAEDAKMDGFVSSDAALQFFARFGMEAGCTIGFPTSSTRGWAVMALIARPGLTQDHVDEILAVHSKALFILATVAHRSMTALPYLGNGQTLTSRQREVLEWVADGKTVADIARILNLAQPTVEKHLKLARETLAVETTAHAVIKAAFLNQMFIRSSSGMLENG